jgi:hypothetical protein
MTTGQSSENTPKRKDKDFEAVKKLEMIRKGLTLAKKKPKKKS